ncbi:MAG: Ig-like domain-containing protein [Patescibacteria group bacterium]
MKKKIYIPVLIVIFILLIAIGAYFLTRKTSNIKIIAINPINLSEQISIFPTISIETSSTTGVDIEKQVKVEFEPEFEFQKSINGSIISITPNEPLQVGTQYKMIVFNNDIKISESSFKTSTSSQLTPDEQAKLQTFLDLQYSQSIDQEYLQKPWLRSFPIDTPQYVLVYDSEINKIRARIKTKATNYDVLQKEIQNKVKALNVPDTIGIQFIFPN